MHPTTAARRAALFTIPAGVLAATVALTGPASAATASGPGAGAGRFLATQLAGDGGLFLTTFDGQSYPDYGLTLDAILGLAASGTSGAQANRSTTSIADHIKDYTTYEKDLYSGPTAKALLVAVVENRDPRSFGGVNLITQLQGLQEASGRFGDKSQYDSSNMIGQSLAIIGLKRAGVGADAKAVSYLEQQQCTDGGFTMGSPGEKGCSSDPDVTAFAVQALVAGGGKTAVLSKAVSYLKAKQGTDGGVGGAGPTAAENANSTGLAAAAFVAAGDTSAASKAKSYLLKLQLGCTYPAALRGAIAYNPDALAALKAKGAGAKVSDQERRSTTQATLGITGQSYLSVTASGVSATPADQCTTPPPTSTQPSGSATGSATNSVTGPPVITDGPDSGSSSVAGGFAIAVVGGAALGAGGVAVSRRARGRHTR